MARTLTATVIKRGGIIRITFARPCGSVVTRDYPCHDGWGMSGALADMAALVGDRPWSDN